MKKIALLTAVLATLLVAAQARAQDTSTYFGISGGAVYTDASVNVAAMAGGSYDDNVPNGSKIYIGRTWDKAGFELGYYNLGTYDFVNSLGALQNQLNTAAITVSGVYSVPLGQGYGFNAKLGVAFTDVKYECKLTCGGTSTDTTQKGVSGLYGVGLAWRAATNFSLRIDFEHFGTVHHSISSLRFKNGYDMFSAGVQVQF